MARRKKNNFQKWLAYMKKTSPEDARPYPTPTSADAGKVLVIGEDGKPTWAEQQQGLPEIKDTDKNKVLVVDSNGNPTWGTTASGDIPLGENESIGIFKE